MKSTTFLALLLLLVISAFAQEDTTTEAPPANGVPYGGICNGFLLQCNRHSSTVACTYRHPLNTTHDACETGLDVDLGICQCSRNCDAEGIYHPDRGEFDPLRDICVGLVGAVCTGLAPNCTSFAVCNFLTSKCVCEVGYVPDASGLRCVKG
jgi:hypothetical protein